MFAKFACANRPLCAQAHGLKLAFLQIPFSAERATQSAGRLAWTPVVS